jgi:NitT/TauT family transport system permease protein
MPEAKTEAETPAGRDRDFGGLDALQTGGNGAGHQWRKRWNKIWPPIAAVAVALVAWQLVVWTGWRPQYALPGPRVVFERLLKDIKKGEVFGSAAATLKRAGLGYALSLVIGGAVGLAVSQSKLLRAAVGSLITGLQTMPSIAWFPLAVLLFKLSEGAIYFVVVLGAAPSVANGLITGIDHVPPVLLRAGKVLGAKGMSAYRHVILPAALPSFVGGLKQAWAFSWRSLMAAELLANIGFPRPLGVRLQDARDNLDAPRVLGTMIVILVIGIVIDSAVFGTMTRAIRKRYGLIDAASV